MLTFCALRCPGLPADSFDGWKAIGSFVRILSSIIAAFRIRTCPPYDYPDRPSRTNADLGRGSG